MKNMKMKNMKMMLTAGVLLFQSVVSVYAAEGEQIRTGTPGSLKCEGAVSIPFEPGAVLFSDRRLTLSVCPDALKGMRFLRVPVDGVKTVTCDRAGTVWVLTASTKKGITQAEVLKKQGFKLVDLPEFRLFPGEAVAVYQKDCAAGEKITFSRWALPLLFEPLVLG
jgi:hypothetical protein